MKRMQVRIGDTRLLKGWQGPQSMRTTDCSFPGGPLGVLSSPGTYGVFMGSPWLGPSSCGSEREVVDPRAVGTPHGFRAGRLLLYALPRQGEKLRQLPIWCARPVAPDSPPLFPQL